MDQAKVKQLQELQLKMMKIIHNICVEYKVDYYIIGGTALGSIRHKGFIPWDIDIDIAMTRQNYIKFKDIAMTTLPPQMNYKDYTLEAEFFSPHALVEWEDSYIISAKDNHRRKIFIDIFPLDFAPNETKLQIKQAQMIKWIDYIKSCKLLSKSDHLNVSFLKKMAFNLFRLFNPFINVDEINIRIQKLMQMYNLEHNARYLCSMASHYSYKKQCMPKNIYGKPTLMTFCDTEFYGPEKPHEYLKRIYGDYMKLPSKDSQIQYMNCFTDAAWSE